MYHQKPVIGIKGRIQTRVIQNEDGSKKKKTEIIAEKVTFLAQASNNKEKQPDKVDKEEKEIKKTKKEKKKN